MPQIFSFELFVGNANLNLLYQKLFRDIVNASFVELFID
jgi:hypothetical protein